MHTKPQTTVSGVRFKRQRHNLRTIAPIPYLLNSKQRKNAVPATGNDACEFSCETACEILERPYWRNQLDKVAGIFSWHQGERPQR